MSLNIHGHSVEGDPEGIKYLERLDAGEVQTFFDEAKRKGRAKFKYNQKHYELAHTSSGTYAVMRIKQSNWF